MISDKRTAVNPLDPTWMAGIGRILIMKWSALGDVIISTTMFEDIRRAFPDAVIDLHILPAFSPIFDHDPRFGEVLTFDVRASRGRWRQALAWLRHVYGRYDLIIDLQSVHRIQVLLGLLRLTGGAPRYIAGYYRWFPWNIAPPSGDYVHAIDLQRAVLRAVGIEPMTRRPVVHIAPAHRQHCAELMARHALAAGRFAALLPGSAADVRLKRWGAARYAELAKLLRARGVEKVVLLGGPDDQEECARIAEACQAEWLVNLCGETGILDLIPLFAAARLIVGNDSGTAHVASCTETPVIIICGPTDPRRVKPVGVNVAALQAEGLDCLNCYGKSCDHHSCMARITPDQVLAALPPEVFALRGRLQKTEQTP